MLKLLVLPKSTNPYQALLYTPLASKVTVSYGFLTTYLRYSYPLVLIVARIRGTRLLHLHWPYWLTINLPNIRLRRFITTLNVYLFIILVKALGYTVIRTMHNVLPHERQTIDDVKVAHLLAKQASVNIVHSVEATAQMDELGIDTSKNTIIPIGSYENLYDNNISPEEARKKLGFRPDEFIILFFGIIREYKGVDDLLCAYRTIEQRNTRLVIAGLCDQPELDQHLKELGLGLPVTYFNKFIPDEDVAIFFQSCDVVCLPFKRITTSSSVLLAMAFEKAVISPRIGALADLPGDAVLFYDENLANGLYDALNYSIQNPNKLKAIAKAGRRYSRSLSWSNIAEKTYALYKGL